jgi:hypothetical protein
MDARRAAPKLWHLSWWQIVTEAIVQHRHHGVADPDQAWILAELIAYLDSAASSAGGFDDMGPNSVPVRTGAPDRTLRRAIPPCAMSQRGGTNSSSISVSVSHKISASG